MQTTNTPKWWHVGKYYLEMVDDPQPMAEYEFDFMDGLTTMALPQFFRAANYWCVDNTDLPKCILPHLLLMGQVESFRDQVKTEFLRPELAMFLQDCCIGTGNWDKNNLAELCLKYELESFLQYAISLQINIKADTQLFVHAIAAKNMPRLQLVHKYCGTMVDGIHGSFKESDNLGALAACIHGTVFLDYLLEHGYFINCSQSYFVSIAAARVGNLAGLRWAKKHNHWGGSQILLEIAVTTENVDCVQFIHESGSTQMDGGEYIDLNNTCCYAVNVCCLAAKHGELECLRYLHEHGYVWGNTAIWAASHGKISCLQYAHEHGCPWGDDLYLYTTYMQYSIDDEYDILNCVKYAYEHGCPVNRTNLAAKISQTPIFHGSLLTYLIGICK